MVPPSREAGIGTQLPPVVRTATGANSDHYLNCLTEVYTSVQVPRNFYVPKSYFLPSPPNLCLFRVLNVTGAGYADCNGLYTLSNNTSIWDSKRVVYERIAGGWGREKRSAAIIREDCVN